MQSPRPPSNFPHLGAPRIDSALRVFRSGKPTFSLHQRSYHFSLSAMTFGQRIQPCSLGDEDGEGFHCVGNNIVIKFDPVCKNVCIEVNRAVLCLRPHHVAVATFNEIHQASDDILKAITEKSAVELEGHCIPDGGFLLRVDIRLDQAGFECIFVDCFDKIDLLPQVPQNVKVNTSDYVCASNDDCEPQLDLDALEADCNFDPRYEGYIEDVKTVFNAVYDPQHPLS
jgi:hypothetical protein